MTTLRDVFTQRANDIGPADLDLGELIELGEHRLRRRRIIATVGSAAAVVLAIALALGGAALNRSADRDPTDHPTNTHSTDNEQTDNQSGPDEPQARPLVYVDDDLHGGGTTHIGDREVTSGGGHMDPVDGGFVYTTENGQLWFSAGGRPKQIASHICGRSWSVVPNNQIGAYEQNAVVTGNDGSLIAWFECSQAPFATLIAYDAESGEEIARQPITACARKERAICELSGIVGDHVYIGVSAKSGASEEGPVGQVRCHE